jgi:hypothetical protein
MIRSTNPMLAWLVALGMVGFVAAVTAWPLFAP